jgi:[ribosomal protein S18]-alanine N-acetyltransferase
VTQAAAPAREPLIVRRLGLGDLPQVLPIERRSFSAPWSLAMFGLEVSKPSTVSLAAFRGARMVGYLVCSRYAGVWHLMNVAVDLDCRRRGVAAALLRALFEQVDRPGAEYTLEVRPSNAGAVALYERFGFHSAGRRPGYYHDNREDALVMWRRLPAA